MKGDTLIEVLVALGLIGVVATALAGVVVTSIGNTRNSKDQSLTTQYAQEGMEIVRQKRDNNYAEFRAIDDGTYCLRGGSSTLGSDCATANVGNFLRKIIIEQNGCATSIARVVVTVSWRDSKCAANVFCHTSRMESCLSSVNPMPTL